jgi:hypothetical protein
MLCFSAEVFAENVNVIVPEPPDIGTTGPMKRCSQPMGFALPPKQVSLALQIGDVSLEIVPVTLFRDNL